jgi:hypothetical protein
MAPHGQRTLQSKTGAACAPHTTTGTAQCCASTSNASNTGTSDNPETSDTGTSNFACTKLVAEAHLDISTVTTLARDPSLWPTRGWKLAPHLITCTLVVVTRGHAQ